MASASILEAKKQQVAAISERLNGAVAGVIVDYKGTSVADDTALRAEEQALHHLQQQQS